MQTRPTLAVQKARKHYQVCAACTNAESLTLGKIQHVIDHLPEECELFEFTDSQFLALFMTTYRTPAPRKGRYPFDHLLAASDYLGAIWERELTDHLTRLLRQERAMIRREAKGDKKLASKRRSHRMPRLRP